MPQAPGEIARGFGRCSKGEDIDNDARFDRGHPHSLR